MKSTVYPPSPLRLPIRPRMPLIPTLLSPFHKQTMNPHPNVLYAFPRRARSFFYPAVIWSRAASVPSTWLSLAPGVPSLTPKRNQLPLGTIMRRIPGTQKPLRRKRKDQEPQLKLNSTRLKPPTEGRGGPRGGSVLYADNPIPHSSGSRPLSPKRKKLKPRRKRLGRRTPKRMTPITHPRCPDLPRWSQGHFSPEERRGAGLNRPPHLSSSGVTVPTTNTCW